MLNPASGCLQLSQEECFFCYWAKVQSDCQVGFGSPSSSQIRSDVIDPSQWEKLLQLEKKHKEKSHSLTFRRHLKAKRLPWAFTLLMLWL